MSKAFISRKDFLKKLWWILLLPYVMLMALMTKRHNSVSEIQEHRIKNAFPEGISFFDDMVCVNKDSEIKFFHSRCTHLGCRINKVENNLLVCPCHGSAFNLEGKAVKGPANKALKELEYEVDKMNNEFVIKLS